MPTGGYIRHRNRMVQESVFDDLRNTLIACRWMSGTTSRPVVDPEDPGSGWQILTRTVDDVLPLAGKREDGSVAEVVLIDFFPEASENEDEANESRKTEYNTFAVDAGEPQEPQYVEMGSNLQEQQYIFTMVFYAAGDAVALAMLNDLKDRYAGRIVADDHINLFNYNDPIFSDATPPVARMEVDGFRYKRDEEDQVTPWEVSLYYAELVLTDYVDAQSPTSVPEPQRALRVMTGEGAPGDDIEADVYIDTVTGYIYGQE